MEYFVRFWGKHEPEALAALGLEQPWAWFDKKEDFDRTMHQLRSLYESLDRPGLVWSTKDGNLTHKRTVVIATLEYLGKTYVVEQDFHYEYPQDIAQWCWEENNQACDCSRADYIREQHDPNFPEMECGNTINLKAIRIELRD